MRQILANVDWKCKMQSSTRFFLKWEVRNELSCWADGLILPPAFRRRREVSVSSCKNKKNVITAHFARCSVGKGKRGARKGEERDSRGTENLGLSLPSMFQEWNRTSAWTGKTLREIPDQLGHNSYHRDYILYLWNKQVSSNLRGPGICLHKAR